MKRRYRIILFLVISFSFFTINAQENPFQDIRVNIKANSMNQAISKAERDCMNQFYDQVLTIHKHKLSTYYPYFQASGQSLSLSLYNEVIRELAKPKVKGDQQSFTAGVFISADSLYDKSLIFSQNHYSEALKYYQNAQRELKQFNTIQSLNRNFCMSIDHLLQCIILSNDEWIQAQMIISEYEQFLGHLIVDAPGILTFKEGDKHTEITFSIYYYLNNIKIPLSGINISLIKQDQVEKAKTNQSGNCRFIVKQSSELRYQIHLMEELYSDKYEHPLFIQYLLGKNVGTMQGETRIEFLKPLAIRVESRDFNDDQLTQLYSYYQKKGYTKETASSDNTHVSTIKIVIIEERYLKIGGYYFKAMIENILTDQSGHIQERQLSEVFEIFSNKDRKDAKEKLRLKAYEVFTSMMKNK